MQYNKATLLEITRKLESDTAITPHEISYLRTFVRTGQEPRIVRLLKMSAVPFSLVFGFLYTVFPDHFAQFTARLPSWTNLPPMLLSGVDYLWDLLGEPVRKQNLLYHLPNIVLYSFGIFGLKKLFEALDRRSWLDRVLNAQKKLTEQLQAGTVRHLLKSGHSLLFVGKGDFIGMQFALNDRRHDPLTISQVKPAYSDLWNYYPIDTTYEDLKTVLIRAGGDTAGEYVFFPVKDDQIFLPSPEAYDLSPYKLDILCQNIRMIEKELKWKPKRIIIIGDKDHNSCVQSEEKTRLVKHSLEVISLDSITKKYKQVTLLDPTDIVLTQIITIAAGRKIVFRATREGIAEYKKRFYRRLERLRYKIKKSTNGTLTIGYDLFEDQTEQQTLHHKGDGYFPVVLSKNVRDALIRNGYKKSEFLYVPELVLTTLAYVAAEQ